MRQTAFNSLSTVSLSHRLWQRVPCGWSSHTGCSLAKLGPCSEYHVVSRIGVLNWCLRSELMFAVIMLKVVQMFVVTMFVEKAAVVTFCQQSVWPEATHSVWNSEVSLVHNLVCVFSLLNYRQTTREPDERSVVFCDKDPSLSDHLNLELSDD